jgi:hypothetical protein
MKGKNLDPKTRALLSLQAMVIGYPGVYRPQEYMHYIMAQLEKLKKVPQPWKSMDSEQYKTFQSLVVEHLGKERRARKDRRKVNRKVRDNKRAADRRWMAKPNDIEKDG